MDLSYQSTSKKQRNIRNKLDPTAQEKGRKESKKKIRNKKKNEKRKSKLKNRNIRKNLKSLETYITN